MRVALAGDHWGVDLKAQLVDELRAAGHEPLDLGANDRTPSDYPVFARRVGDALRDGRAERGVIICGSGVGVCVQSIDCAVYFDGSSALIAPFTGIGCVGAIEVRTCASAVPTC